MKAKYDVRASSGPQTEGGGGTCVRKLEILNIFYQFLQKVCWQFLRGWERFFHIDSSHLWSMENPKSVTHLIMNESGVTLLLERSKYLIRSKY